MKLTAISYLRTLSVIFILMCHLLAHCPISALASLSQFFNIGVEIFFCISAFCFGLAGGVSNPINWYKKRLKRIAIPYELFLFGLAIIYVVLGKKLPLGNWLSCVCFAQGANVGVLGADHTWFITAIMLCYIVTPLLSKIWTKLDGKRGAIILPVMFFVIPLSMPFFMNSYAYTIVHCQTAH